MNDLLKRFDVFTEPSRNILDSALPDAHSEVGGAIAIVYAIVMFALTIANLTRLNEDGYLFLNFLADTGGQAFLIFKVI